MTADIRVYAQFPNEPSVLKSTIWSWAHCLTFPVDKLDRLQFSHKPYKWIRFATGVVVGARGHLSCQRDSPFTHFNYDDTLPNSSIDLYYHVFDEKERLRMFPLDPELENARVTSSSTMSSRQATFRHIVKERDGCLCVLSELPEEVCDAAHLLKHSKGSSYIHTFTTSRQRNPNDIIQDIDSVRNGLFLNCFTHRILGQGVAILVTPNFAMETEAVLQVGPAMQEQTKKRFTVHLFDVDKPWRLGWSNVSSGSAMRVPAGDDNIEWPPDILFDAVYAIAVVHHFGEPLKDVLAPWEKLFYSSDGSASALLADQTAPDSKRNVTFNQQTLERDDRYKRRDEMDSFDVLMFLPYMCMSPEKVMNDMRERQEEMAVREHEALEAKVNAWREDALSSS